MTFLRISTRLPLKAFCKIWYWRLLWKTFDQLEI